ncbi:hypothetical protein FSP39_009313 [Pinctada imbricata]|uniref:Golgin-45 n=1 Tax=Pinctada imbricata TaxID=66713 RepID=A0AA89BYD1_PINIB|nr:hypothetical protein FSP39_009313 [Pinctada imbricata]
MATVETLGKQQILPNKPIVKIETTSNGQSVKRSKRSASEERGTILLRQPLPKYSFQVKEQKVKKNVMNSVEQKYSQPVANVSPSVRGNTKTEQQGNVVTTEKSVRRSNSNGYQYVGVDSVRYGEIQDGDENALTLQEALESLAFPSPSEKNPERKRSQDRKEVERLQKENEELKRQLESQVSSLKKQLDVQLQVNTELKRLLVASVGDDLHFTMEHLARDKAQLAKELGDFSKKLSEDYEHLDKISIQADMWRSKFLASRVMIDELAGAKAFFAMKFQESQNVLQQMLNERHEVRRNLYETHRCLQQIRSAFDPLNSHSTVSTGSTNTIDLARANHRLTENIKYRLLPYNAASQLVVNMEPSMQDNLTLAESQAQELLSRNSDSEEFAKIDSYTRSAMVERYHPSARFDNLTLNCCDRCKGELSAV